MLTVYFGPVPYCSISLQLIPSTLHEWNAVLQGDAAQKLSGDEG